MFLSWNRNHTQKLSNWDNVAITYNNELSSVCLRRVNAERDIVPEFESDDESVSVNGNGATNLITSRTDLFMIGDIHLLFLLQLLNDL